MKKIKWKLLLAIVALGAGCVKIPEGYYGTFQDHQLGAQLVLGQNKAELTLPGGRKVKASSKDLTFSDLWQGKGGLYDTEDKSSGMIEVYFVNPVAGTRQEQAGFSWFTSEVLYTYFAAGERGQVPMIQVVHCTNGTVLLDQSTQRIQVGCPESPVTYNLARVR